MLVQRQRQWVNVNATLTQRILFAGSVTHAPSVQYNKKGHMWVEICARMHYVKSLLNLTISRRACLRPL